MSSPFPLAQPRKCPGLRLHTPVTARAQRTEGVVYVCGVKLEAGQDRCASCGLPKRRRVDHVLRAILRPEWEAAQAQVLGERAPEGTWETPEPVRTPERRRLPAGSPRDQLERFLSGERD